MPSHIGEAAHEAGSLTELLVIDLSASPANEVIALSSVDSSMGRSSASAADRARPVTAKADTSRLSFGLEQRGQAGILAVLTVRDRKLNTM